MKTLVMHRMLEYKLEEVPTDVSHDWLRENIGGWPETAVKITPDKIRTILPRCARGGPGIMIMCDSDGHPKNLDLTMFRITDGAPLVGKLYWLSYKEFSTVDGPDYSMHALTENQLANVIKNIQKMGWAEIIIDSKLSAECSTAEA